MKLNSKQDKALRAIFANPVKSNIKWSDVESLFVALGGTLREGRGSRVKVVLGDRLGMFHRPHPRKTIGKATVLDVRVLLTEAGFSPGDDDDDG